MDTDMMPILRSVHVDEIDNEIKTYIYEHIII